MASVPNMRGFQLAPPAATPPTGEAEFGKQFPALTPATPGDPVAVVPAAAPVVPELSLGPVPVSMTTQPVEAMRGAPAPAPDAPDTDDADKPAPDPAAPADLLPVVQAQVSLPVWVVTTIATPIVPTTTQPVEEPQRPTGLPSVEADVAAPFVPCITNDAPAPKAPDAPAKPTAKAPTAKAPQPADPEMKDKPIEAQAPAPAPVVAAPLSLSTLIAALDPAPAPAAAPVERGPAGAAAPADPVIERELDLARDGEWLDRLARDIARAGANDGGPIRFRLHPASLGHLRVELAQGDHGTSIRLTVETEAARAILTDAQPRLLAEARAQGVRVAQTEVDLGGSGHEAASQDPRRQADGTPAQLIRTARGGARDAAAAAGAIDRPRRRAERYA